MWRPATGIAGKTGATGSGKGWHGYSLVHRSSSMSDELKVAERWFSDRVQAEVTVVRWGTFGTPVLVLPSAGGDAEEVERVGLVGACGPRRARLRLKPCTGGN